MAILTFTQVGKAYGHQEVLTDVSFLVNEGDRVGIVGPNGAGKSTLLRLVTADEQPDGGRISLAPNIRLGVLRQDPLTGDARTVREAAERPEPRLEQLWQSLLALEGGSLQGDAGDEYHRIHALFEDLGGYQCRHRAPGVLVGLGFQPELWDRPVAVLSGGERTRLALVQLLVLQPDLLLLDEPTNHVDWEASDWLQAYLATYPGTVMIVSHDRFFLDRTVHRILELNNTACTAFLGNYTQYRRKKAAQLELESEQYRRHVQEIERQEAIVQKYRSHRNFSGMHSREKLVEDLRGSLSPPPRAARSLRIHQREVAASGEEVLRTTGLGHGFDRRSLFRGLGLILRRGERLGIIGPNGAGKSTLLHCLAGRLVPREGRVEYGHRVQPALFTQDLSALDPTQTVWETIWSTGALNLTESMQALHQFLFVSDALDRVVGDLSGGEQTRLALCRLLITSPNLLLLDEPTNHLDIPSREAVEQALRHYKGTLVVVSHDRYLLQAVTTRTLRLAEGRHRLIDRGFGELSEADLNPPKPAAVTPRAAPAPPASAVKPLSPSKRLPRLERDIADHEAEQERLRDLLQDPTVWADPVESRRLAEGMEQHAAALEALYAEWAAVAAAVEGRGA